MENNLITVVTPTVGNGSPRRLLYLLREMRQFTKLDYEHIVCDDGTISPGTHAIQKEICKLFGAKFILNNGPHFGASFALNRAIEHVKTRWVYVVDDGCRPSYQWLEAAVEFVRNTGESLWNKRQIGMAGAYAIDQVNLCLGNVFGENTNVNDYLQSDKPWKPHVIESFYGDWNDGHWGWHRLAPQAFKRVIESKNPTAAEKAMRDMFIRRLKYERKDCDYENFTKNIEDFRNVLMDYTNLNHWGGFWPHRRTAEMTYFSTPLSLINVALFNKVGKFRDFCWLYEGHLAIRFGLAGHLALAVEQPPWLHLGNQASFDSLTDAHQPRLKLVEELFLKDFGATTAGVIDLIDKVIGPKERIYINGLLRNHPLGEL